MVGIQPVSAVSFHAQRPRELVQPGCRSGIVKIGSGDRSATHLVMERATEQSVPDVCDAATRTVRQRQLGGVEI